MEYVILGAGIIAGIHAFSYAMWVKQQGNQAGVLAIYILIALVLGVSTYIVIRG